MGDARCNDKPVLIKQDPDAPSNTELLMLQQAPNEDENNLNIFLANPHWDDDMKREAEEALFEDDPLPLISEPSDDDSEGGKKNLKEKLGRFLHNRSATANRTVSSEHAISTEVNPPAEHTINTEANPPIENKVIPDDQEMMEGQENEVDDDDLLEQNDDDLNDNQNDNQIDDFNEEED